MVHIWVLVHVTIGSNREVEKHYMKYENHGPTEQPQRDMNSGQLLKKMWQTGGEFQNV